VQPSCRSVTFPALLRVGSPMKQGLIFIASLSHSGSTLLNLLLGTHPKLVGLGEIDSVLQIPASKIEGEMGMGCSCGKPVRTCEFWGPTLAALQASSDASLSEKYEIVFQSFQNIYGPNYQIVDSSKYLGQLNNVRLLPNVEISVIQLIKDVRAFTISQRDIIEADFKYKRLPVLLGSPKFSAWFYRHTTKSPAYLFWKWYRDNLAIQKQLASWNLRTTRVGYDRLAQQPAEVLAELYRFLELEIVTAEKLVPHRTNSHVFLGNQMLADKAKMSEIRYDDRWMKRDDWRRAARLFPNILAYSDEMVYSG
jgi:hypothetical protein